MTYFSPKHGIGTIANHASEGTDPYHAHVTPIYQTSTFSADDMDTMLAVFRGERRDFVYTRAGNPNQDQAARKIAVLEGLDILRASPHADPDALVAGRVFASGMAAVSAVMLARLRAGDTLLAQRALYGGTYRLLTEILPAFGVKVIWVDEPTPAGWQAAFQAHPDARLVYAETPINPTLKIVDLQAVVEIAHAHDAWVMVDNTFATPYCQRPLNQGVDVVVHSTTKYLAGHGVLIGGAVVSTRLDFMKDRIGLMARTIGGVASPFDSWLTNFGLKTFELRMKRHCKNALALAEFLEKSPRVVRVNYPGLKSHPGHELARKQMDGFGGMLSFEVEGEYQGAKTVIDSLKLATLIPSLGNTDTLVAHPASMSHAVCTPEDRQKMGIGEGLVRLSVGIENVEDIQADLEQALAKL